MFLNIDVCSCLDDGEMACIAIGPGRGSSLETGDGARSSEAVEAMPVQSRAAKSLCRIRGAALDRHNTDRILDF